MNKVYSRINWENEPSTKTPLNEHNLNKIDFAVDEIDNRVIELDSTKAKNTDLQTLSTRVDNLILNAGDSSAECTDARVTEDGTTYDTLKKRLDAEHSSVTEDISQLSNEIDEICNNNFDGYQFLKEKNRTDNQYYNNNNNNNFEIITIDEPYATYEPLELIAGTYYFHNISHYFSFVKYKNGTVIRLLDLTNVHSDYQVVNFTFTENVTLYITVYNISFDNFPAITKGFMCADNVEGAFSIKGVNLTSMTRWRNGSYRNGNEWAVYDYFDDDYRYTTSNTFEFDYPVMIKNTDTSKYLYYIAYMETMTTDYGNKTVIIPSNTKFRIAVKYKDDRLLTNEEQVYLRENVIIIQNMNYSYVNEISEGENVIITVGENANYSTIQEALNVITDANENKRYTVLVKRGVYDISNANINHLPLMSYVHIKGESKTGTVIKFYSDVKNAEKNVFDNHQTLLHGGLSEVSNFTIETNNIKGALHLDDGSWNGMVYFHDVIINSISTEEDFDGSLDYYQFMRASKGVVNLGIHLNQKVVIENVQTNGYIYSHSTVSAFTDMENENAGTFEVRNCTCDWIGVYGNGEAVRKKCVFEGNKCKFIKIAFIDNYNLGVMCWDVVLKNNHTDFIACQYFEYNNTSENKNLVDNYYGTFPFADPNLHNVIHNTTGVDIMFGSKLKYTDYTRRYVTVVSGNDYDAIAVQTIKTDLYGVVQEGGNKEHYLEYLKTHELS